MYKDKKTLLEKWGFMTKKKMIPGLIVDNVTHEDMVSWMDSTPYEQARDRMNRADVENLIIEFVEMMWCIEPDYYELKSILNTEFHKQNEDHGIVITCEVKKDTVKLLSKMEMLLHKEDKTIRILKLYVREQPQLNVLQQQLDEISPEFIVTQDESRICIQWQDKQVIVTVEP